MKNLTWLFYWRMLPGKKLLIATILINIITKLLPADSFDWIILQCFLFLPLCWLMMIITIIHITWKLYRRRKIPRL